MQPDEDLHLALALHVKFQSFTTISLLCRTFSFTETRRHAQTQCLTVVVRLIHSALYMCDSDYERMLETDLAVKSFLGKLLMKFHVSTAYLTE